MHGVCTKKRGKGCLWLITNAITAYDCRGQLKPFSGRSLEGASRCMGTAARNGVLSGKQRTLRFPSLDRVPAKNLLLPGPTETRGPMPPVPRAVHASKLKLYHLEWRKRLAPWSSSPPRANAKTLSSSQTIRERPDEVQQFAPVRCIVFGLNLQRH